MRRLVASQVATASTAAPRVRLRGGAAEGFLGALRTARKKEEEERPIVLEVFSPRVMMGPKVGRTTETGDG